ncbi:hypothetical protein NPIL_346681 [Nephila pilipes]|uniref:Uncharacterized protein n=1 Tax=Nephila pilipes TaxID=299642 RepID=A0A8X6TA13_NEPPI|nr:hypothetical protein NPIL_346681 [Nephila pilipes]
MSFARSFKFYLLPECHSGQVSAPKLVIKELSSIPRFQKEFENNSTSEEERDGEGRADGTQLEADMTSDFKAQNPRYQRKKEFEQKRELLRRKLQGMLRPTFLCLCAWRDG